MRCDDVTYKPCIRLSELDARMVCLGQSSRKPPRPATHRAADCERFTTSCNVVDVVCRAARAVSFYITRGPHPRSEACSLNEHAVISGVGNGCSFPASSQCPLSLETSFARHVCVSVLWDSGVTTELLVSPLETTRLALASVPSTCFLLAAYAVHHRICFPAQEQVEMAASMMG